MRQWWLSRATLLKTAEASPFHGSRLTAAFNLIDIMTDILTWNARAALGPTPSCMLSRCQAYAEDCLLLHPVIVPAAEAD